MIRSRLHILFLLLLACSHVYAQRQAVFSFDSLFAKYPEQFDSIIAHKEDYRLQLLYTRIDRDANNVPHLTTYSYDADKYYYYCASMMKLPACALTLEKLNNLSKYHVNMLDSLGLDSITCTDLSPAAMMLGTSYSRLSQYIKEMLLVSNNNAFNPVYDFLGQYDFQERMHRLGYASTVISNRYAGCDTIQNRRCDPVALYDPHTHQLKYQQPCIINQDRQFYQGALSPLVGDGYLYGGALINEPKSFRFANYIKLSELHRLLTKIILPETQTSSEKFNLTRSDYQYLYKCMGMVPRECAYPDFDSVKYPDNYMKYFMGLDSGTYTMPANIRIFNKVGQAYGFMTDCSYVVDTLNKVEFFLSCAVYTNANGILNDGKYEYDQTAYPFFHNIFNAVYSEELMRHKDHLPRLVLPDFSDTLLVKPRLPIWMLMDSTADIVQMEHSLCVLHDSLSSASDPARSKLTKVFADNLSVVLRQSSSYDYSFDELGKRIDIRTSPDKNLRVFLFSIPSQAEGYLQGAYFLYNGEKSVGSIVIGNHCEDNSKYPFCDELLDQVKTKKGKVCYLWRNCAGALSAYNFDESGIHKASIFSIDGGILADSVSMAGFVCDHTLPRVKKKISFKVYTSDEKERQLKFDGSIFR